MDDIYFSKKNQRRSGDRSGKQHIDLPAVNQDDRARDYSADPNAISFNKRQSFSPPDAGNETYLDYQQPSRRQNAQDAYAPYHGRQKKMSRAEREVFNEYTPEAVEDVYSSSGEKKGKRSKEAPPQKPAKAKKKKGCFRPIKLAAWAVIICLAASFVFIFGAAAFSGYKKTDLDPNQYISSASLASNPLVRNILLIGVDGKSDNGSLRSDSMILVSVDSVHSKIKLSSFMRDSWLKIPDYKYAKLNAACSHGGPQLVVDTIEYNFKVDIEDYVLVDFEMFTKIIDAIGGVNVEVTEKEASFINRTTRHTIDSGESVHLNGAQALVYCRIRKLDSDYMRTYRQRKVIKALINQAKSAGVTKLVAAMRDVLPMIETNMSPASITLLAYRAGFAAMLYDIQSTRIPTDKFSWNGTEGSQSVVELDVDANAEYLYQYIYTGTVDPDAEDSD